MSQHTASPEARRLIAFQHIAVKEQIWLGSNDSAIQLLKRRLKKSDESYRNGLEALNAGIIAAASQDPVRIQESLSRPSGGLTKRNPKVDVSLMNWAFLNLECGDSGMAQQFLESWPRQRETIFWGSELTREFLLTKIYLEKRLWVKAHISCQRATVLFDVVDSFRESIAYFHVELVPGVRPAFVNLVNEFQKGHSETDVPTNQSESQLHEISELTWQPDLSRGLEFAPVAVTQSVLRYEDLAKIPAYENPDVLSANEAFKRLMELKPSKVDSKKNANPFLDLPKSEYLVVDETHGLSVSVRTGSGDIKLAKTGQPPVTIEEFTKRVYALPIKKQAFFEFCWCQLLFACVELCLESLCLELEDEFAIQRALQIIEDPRLLEDRVFLIQLSKDAFSLINCEGSFKRERTRFDRLLSGLNTSICKGVELLTEQHEFIDRDFSKPSYLWKCVYRIYYYSLRMKDDPIGTTTSRYADPKFSELRPEVISHPSFLAVWKVIDVLLQQLESDCLLSEIKVPKIKKSHFINLY